MLGLSTWIILSFINIYGFCLMGIDKKRAKEGKYRISERALWITAICGGVLGVILGMNTFRHKTKHISFRVGLPLLLLAESFLLYPFMK